VTDLNTTIETIIGVPPTAIRPLTGGMIGEVYQVELADGRAFVAKVDDSPHPRLDIEGYMLRYLAEHSRLPVPEVVHTTPELLLMTFLEGSSTISPVIQQHAAELLADLHTVSAPAFGLDRDTLSGGLPLANPWTESWLDFFRDQRLLYAGRESVRIGRLPSPIFSRLEKLAARLDRCLLEPEHPSLIHGDVWSANLLTQNGRITGFIDPAIYYGHAEIELTYVAMFNTFGAPFFERYQALRPIQPGFFEERLDLYSLYPLLIHVWHFGGKYVQSVDQMLSRFGF
jgi:fructosamine-3-kinase